MKNVSFIFCKKLNGLFGHPVPGYSLSLSLKPRVRQTRHLLLAEFNKLSLVYVKDHHCCVLFYHVLLIFYFIFPFILDAHAICPWVEHYFVPGVSKSQISSPVSHHLFRSPICFQGLGRLPTWPSISCHAEKTFISTSFPADCLLISFGVEHFSVMRKPGPGPVAFEAGKTLGAGRDRALAATD